MTNLTIGKIGFGALHPLWNDRTFLDSTTLSKLVSGFSLKEGIYSSEYELPGFKKEDVKITVDNGQLIILAENKTRLKRQRSLNIPDDGNTKGIKATLEDGILRIEMKQDKESPQEIKIS